MSRYHRAASRWLFGIAVLLAAALVASHYHEERAFLTLFAAAEPVWLLVAIVAQLGTYVAQGQIWGRVAAAAEAGQLRPVEMIRLTLAKLFVDQAIPSGGVSGTTFVARVLVRRGGSEDRVTAGAIVNLLGFQLAGMVGLLGVTALSGVLELPAAVRGSAAVLFVLFGGLVVGTLLLRAWGGRMMRSPLRRFQILTEFVALLGRADPALVRSGRLLGTCTGLQLLTLLLDSLTLWAALRALGGEGSFVQIFPGFMIASAVKTIGFVPGGIGLFEASSTAVIAAAGVDPRLALSATLVFRGLSYWLPMIPGLLCARALNMQAAPLSAPLDSYWARGLEETFAAISSSPAGLSAREAAERHAARPVEERPAGRSSATLLLRQLRDPLLLLLVFAAVAAGVSGEWGDSVIVLLIIGGSAGLASLQEARAEGALAELQARIAHRARVLRDGQVTDIPSSSIVRGDVVELSAGSIVPADGLLLTATSLFVSEAALTGEAFPVEKRVEPVPSEAPPARRVNCVYSGSTVRSGTGRFVVVATGAETRLGRIAERLREAPGPTGFERGARHFGYLVLSCMAALTLFVFFLNVQLGRSPVETLLFSVALAVGLSPELLPAILTLNLARGARLMARAGVLVRHLNGIEDLGAMDVLCTDKTGTLTEGVIKVAGAYDEHGVEAPPVFELAMLNAAFQSGLVNPLDEAILRMGQPPGGGFQKLGEVPYDFSRKRLSVVVADERGAHLITKGACSSVLSVCSLLPGERPLTDNSRRELTERFERWSRVGIRVLGVADRHLGPAEPITRACERDLVFRGFVTFLDELKAGVADSITELAALGIAVKLVSGDNALVTRHLARLVGIPDEPVLTGAELRSLTGPALWQAARATSVFAEVEPDQKEDLVIALKRSGHVVGFLGDGINDTPAMHAADVSISVEGAVEVAREAADFVLLERHLDIIRRGIEEGRTTFVNTLKYIRMTMSANLGNTLSLALGSCFLPFLPLLPGQILLNNFLSDIPALGLAADRVDAEDVERPERWELGEVARFMLTFGLVSSFFDLLTLGVLVGLYGFDPAAVRTGWFLESLFSELVVVFLVRTRRQLWRSRPSRVLVLGTIVAGGAGVLTPFLPVAAAAGFVPPGVGMLLTVAGIVIAWGISCEVTKRWFYR